MSQQSNSGPGNQSDQHRSPITQWPKGERPREKLIHRGADALSDAEILAILIGSGTGKSTAVDLARTLLTNSGGLCQLAGMSFSDLVHRRIHGMGAARSAIVIAAFELARRIHSVVGEDAPVIRSPQDVADRMIPKLRHLNHEVFLVLVLDSSNHITKEVMVTKGLLNSSLTHPREVFRAAIIESAASIILIHNHPSGNTEPSAEDMTITHQLVESGKILGIAVHDHIIIAGNGFTSFAERGILN